MGVRIPVDAGFVGTGLGRRGWLVRFSGIVRPLFGVARIAPATRIDAGTPGQVLVGARGRHGQRPSSNTTSRLAPSVASPGDTAVS